MPIDATANRDDAVFPDIVAPLDRSETPAPACVEHILMLFYDSIDSQPDCVRIWLEWSVAIRESLRDSYLKFYHAALHGIGEILRERDARSRHSPGRPQIRKARLRRYHSPRASLSIPREIRTRFWHA